MPFFFNLSLNSLAKALFYPSVLTSSTIKTSSFIYCRAAELRCLNITASKRYGVRVPIASTAGNLSISLLVRLLLCFLPSKSCFLLYHAAHFGSKTAPDRLSVSTCPGSQAIAVACYVIVRSNKQTKSTLTLWCCAGVAPATRLYACTSSCHSPAPPGLQQHRHSLVTERVTCLPSVRQCNPCRQWPGPGRLRHSWHVLSLAKQLYSAQSRASNRNSRHGSV